MKRDLMVFGWTMAILMGGVPVASGGSMPVVSDQEPQLAVSAQDIDFNATWFVKENKEEVNSEQTGYERYSFSHNPDTGFLSYNTPSGTTAQLQVASCATDMWCCTGNYEICYYNYSGSYDDMVALTLEGGRSISCTLLHHEDDTPRKVYFATDAYNGCPSQTPGKPCFLLREEGNTSCPVRPWAGFEIICF